MPHSRAELDEDPGGGSSGYRLTGRSQMISGDLRSVMTCPQFKEMSDEVIRMCGDVMSTGSQSRAILTGMS